MKGSSSWAKNHLSRRCLLDDLLSAPIFRRENLFESVSLSVDWRSGTFRFSYRWATKELIVPTTMLMQVLTLVFWRLFRRSTAVWQAVYMPEPRQDRRWRCSGHIFRRWSSSDQCPSFWILSVLGMMNTVLDKTNLKICWTIDFNCMRRANWISSKTRPQTARKSFVKACLTILYTSHFNLSFRSE